MKNIITTIIALVISSTALAEIRFNTKLNLNLAHLKIGERSSLSSNSETNTELTAVQTCVNDLDSRYSDTQTMYNNYCSNSELIESNFLSYCNAGVTRLLAENSDFLVQFTFRDYDCSSKTYSYSYEAFRIDDSSMFSINDSALTGSLITQLNTYVFDEIISDSNYETGSLPAPRF